MLLDSDNLLLNRHFQLVVDGEIAIITPRAKVFMQVEARELRTLIGHCRAQEIKKLVIDLGECDYISSEGLGIFADQWRYCHEEGKGTLAIVLSQKPGNEIMNLFEITGLSRIIGSSIRSSVADAVKFIKTLG